MSYKIIGDSCTDLTKELKQEGCISLVPLFLTIGNETFVDDETFNQRVFIEKMAKSEECPRSACPSPERYMREFEGAEECYVVTLSAQLSGSYNSAMLAKSMYLEKHPGKKIDIVDSRSASVGQTLIALQIKELKEQGLPFEEVRKKVERYRDELQTKFVLESLENFRKNGRLTNMAAVISNVLNIRPVMSSTPEGQIFKLDQARGMNRALLRMAEYIEKDAINPAAKTLGIAYCHNRDRAEFTKHEILKRVPFKDCILVDTAGVSTLYANEGGIIVAY